MFLHKSALPCLLLAAILAVGGLGCAQQKQESLRDLILRVALNVELASLDPQTTASVDAIKVQSALFETLVRVDWQTGAVQPAAALSWERSADGRTYTLQLDPRLIWSDGIPVTAADYVFAFRRLVDPRVGAPFAELFDGIEGVQALRTGQELDFETLGVVADGPYTLRFELTQRVSYFLTLLARPVAAALPQHFLLERGPIHSRTSGWSLEPGFPSSGPYLLEDWRVNKHLVLRKNHRYRHAGEVTFEKVVFYGMESAYAQEHGLLSGALDVTSKLASERVRRYWQRPELVNQVEMGTFYVITNTESQLLADVGLRLAMSAALDRGQIVRNLRQRGETEANTFTPPLWDAYCVQAGDDPTVPAADYANPGRLRLLISSSENNLQIAEALQAMWQDNLGLEVEIVRQEWKSYLDSRSRGQFDLCLATWIGDYFDPLTFLELWRSEALNNFCRWRNPLYDELLLQAAGAPSDDLRLEKLAQAEALMLSEAPLFPLFYLSRVYLKSGRLDVWPQTLLNTVDYRYVKFARAD